MNTLTTQLNAIRLSNFNAHKYNVRIFGFDIHIISNCKTDFYYCSVFSVNTSVQVFRAKNMKELKAKIRAIIEPRLPLLSINQSNKNDYEPQFFIFLTSLFASLINAPQRSLRAFINHFNSLFYCSVLVSFISSLVLTL